MRQVGQSVKAYKDADRLRTGMLEDSLCASTSCAPLTMRRLEKLKHRRNVFLAHWSVVCTVGQPARGILVRVQLFAVGLPQCLHCVEESGESSPVFTEVTARSDHHDGPSQEKEALLKSLHVSRVHGNRSEQRIKRNTTVTTYLAHHLSRVNQHSYAWKVLCCPLVWYEVTTVVWSSSNLNFRWLSTEALEIYWVRGRVASTKAKRKWKNHIRTCLQQQGQMRAKEANESTSDARML
eukprot:5762042-Amphidinium_carterae.1